MQTFTKVSTNNILQFLQKCHFYNKIEFFFFNFYIFQIFICTSDGALNIVPRVKDDNPFGTQKTVLQDLEEE